MELDLLVCDLDGTLLNGEKKISAYTRRVLRQLQAGGVKIAFATGRNDVYVKGIALQIPVLEPIIACNGASVREWQSGSVIDEHLLPDRAVKMIGAYCLEKGYDFTVSVYDAMYCVYGSRRERIFHEYNAAVEKSCEIPIYRIRSVTDIPTAQVLKMFVWELKQQERQDLIEQFGKDGDVVFVMSEKGGLDIMAKGVSKGNALRHLAAWYGVSLCKVAAFGDQENDISMLKTAGYSFAMKNAARAIQQTARWTTEYTNDEDGVARALERWFPEYF